MIDSRRAGVSWEWPIVERCGEVVVMTDEEREAIENTEGGEYPSQSTGWCALAAGHGGPHHAVVQNVGDGHETWLVWEGAPGLREFRRRANCQLEIPLARERLSATSTCMLFDGHPGPHPMEVPDVWWWGDCKLRSRAATISRLVVDGVLHAVRRVRHAESSPAYVVR